MIEAGILAAVTGLPVFLFLPFSLTARIIVLCLTTLPLVLFALIGISGESLSSFLVIFLKYMKNRRIVGGGESQEAMQAATSAKKSRKSGSRKSPVSSENAASTSTSQDMKTDRNNHKPGKNEKIGGISGWRRRGEEDFPTEFDQVKGYEIRQKLRPSQAQKKQKAGTQRKKSAGERDGVHNMIPEKRPLENQEDRITETAGRKRTIPPESLCTRRNRSLPT